MAIPAPRHDDAHEPARIASFVRTRSFEASRPSPADLAILREAASPAVPIYVSAVPSRPAAEQIATAIALRAAGFEPVPHLAARNFASAGELDAYLACMTAQAGVRRLLVVGGDRTEPAGAFRHAIEAIDSGLLQLHGVDEIGLAGHPEGHARVSETGMARALAAKIEAAEQTGLRVHIVSQFAFSATAIVTWVRRLRDAGCDQEIRIGLAGPASLSALLRFAGICGVKGSALGLARNAGLVKHMFGTTTPDALVRALAAAWAGGGLGDVAPHFYSFGGLAATARWTAAVASGRIDLDGAAGFSLAPP